MLALALAVTAIKEARGKVEYDWENPDAVVVSSSAGFAIPWFPEWPDPLESVRRPDPKEAGQTLRHGWCRCLASTASSPRYVRFPCRDDRRMNSSSTSAGSSGLEALQTATESVVSDEQSMAFLEELDCLEDLTLVRSLLGQGAHAALRQPRVSRTFRSRTCKGTNVRQRRRSRASRASPLAHQSQPERHRNRRRGPGLVASPEQASRD